MPEDCILTTFPDHQVPPPLAQFASEHSGIDYDSENSEVFLYHGTNCYRRWEINRSGHIEPGRSNYSFFCTRAADAYTYARAACLRDVKPGVVNSLICEPVVLKVKFNARTWLQVDFVQELLPFEDEDPSGLSLAVLGPVPSVSVIDVLHCTHGRRLGCASESIRTFEDGTFMESIHHLKEKLMQKRPDAWLLKKLGALTQTAAVRLSGGEVPEITLEDDLRRLRQLQLNS